LLPCTCVLYPHCFIFTRPLHYFLVPFPPITRIYREPKKLNFTKINEPIKKWATELNRTFSKEEVQMDNNKKKKHEKMFTIPGYKGNENQNHIKILPHCC
jgi:hypothetical protein